MKKINASKVLVDLDQAPLVNENTKKIMTMGNSISSCLLSHQGNRLDNMKLFLLGQRFYSEPEVELDDSDFQAVKEICSQSKNFFPIVLGQIEIHLAEVAK